MVSRKIKCQLLNIKFRLKCVIINWWQNDYESNISLYTKVNIFLVNVLKLSDDYFHKSCY